MHLATRSPSRKSAGMPEFRGSLISRIIASSTLARNSATVVSGSDILQSHAHPPKRLIVSGSAITELVVLNAVPVLAQPCVDERSKDFGSFRKADSIGHAQQQTQFRRCRAMPWLRNQLSYAECVPKATR